MSVARQHARWLSLIEVSGPFLSMPVLLRVFPQGLEAHDPVVFRDLRQAYEEWSEKGAARREIHREWVRFVLLEVLGLPEKLLAEGQAIPTDFRLDLPEHRLTVRPDGALLVPEGRPGAGRPCLLLRILEPGQGLDRPIRGERWVRSPQDRMLELLRATGVRLGLVTNGEQWMLIHVPADGTTTAASWYAAIWIEEPETLQAFRSLIGGRRFFGVPDEETPEALFTASAAEQQEVTDQLGCQVRHAIEVLIQAIDRIDRDRQRKLLGDIAPQELYEAALTVMMRLVFLFCAEERRLLPLGNALYDGAYAVSTLRAQLREAADRSGEEVLERRSDAWCRLLATFRAIHGGIDHDLLDLPAHGGRLFDPDRYPFLEGRMGGSWRDEPADPLPIHNRTVLHLLEALQVLQVKVPGGMAEARRVSFRALDVEQIGHIYEGLLDHQAARAEEPFLGLGGSRDSETEVRLALLEELRSRSEDELVRFLKEQIGRSENALRSALGGVGASRKKGAAVRAGNALSLPLAYPAPPAVDDGLLRACDNDRALAARVAPFAALLRRDSTGDPVVIPAGGVFVTRGEDRRSTGTHYTPRSLTEPVVRYTLEPLVYHGPAEGLPPEQWKLRSAREILSLKVCDMAMGSGTLLVATCRYLAERLSEAWSEAGATRHRIQEGKWIIAPDGTASKGAPEELIIPDDPEERLLLARRIVADSCLYGVDKSPMAVEMAKLSLWLVTLQKNRPFTFLDHALKPGDSLIGVSLQELQNASLGTTSQQTNLMVWSEIDKATAARRELEAVPDTTPEHVARKAWLHASAEKSLAKAILLGDLILLPALREGDIAKRQSLADDLLLLFSTVLDEEGWQALRDKADQLLRGLKPFHWHLEFPEVFEGGTGFDAIVGNPPFIGGKRITGALGALYRDHLVEHLADGRRGSADLCAYFFLRAAGLLREGGGFGLLATNTIAQGDTREVGLDQLAAGGCAITRAVSSQKWPGEANLEVAEVWIRRGEWMGRWVLNGVEVSGITPMLTPASRVLGNPYQLRANEDRSFIGSYVLGMGFVMEPEEAQALIDKDPRNQDVLYQYLNGEDLNSRPEQSASRWVINFHDWPRERGAQGSWMATVDEVVRKAWLRSGIVPGDYPYPVAADYPECLAIVEQRAKPERLAQSDRYAQQYWWRFSRTRPELRSAIAGMERVLVTTRVSAYRSFVLSGIGTVFSDRLAVVALSCYGAFAIANSTIHDGWAHRPGMTTHETRPTYNPEEAFETFPFPPSFESLEEIGVRYYDHRQSIMLARQEGLTKTYNRFHNPQERDPEIARLRDLHVEMDRAVAAAYGWTDLDLGHGFHQTKQGDRFTIREAARVEVLDRLLELNHQRYAEEVAAGLHDKKGGKGGGEAAAGKRAGGRKRAVYDGPVLEF